MTHEFYLHSRAKKFRSGFAPGLIVLGIILSMAAVSQANNTAPEENPPAVGEEKEVDPWEPLNAKMFWFNRNLLDQYVLKPVAKAWKFVLPDPVQEGLRNAVDNTNVAAY